MKFNINFILRHLWVQVLLEILHAHFVSVFIFPIVFWPFLHSVIGEMYKFVLDIINIEFFAASSDIGIIVKVTFQITIYWSQHSITSEIKLSPVYQQWVIYVLLNNESPIFSEWWACSFANDAFDFMHSRAYIDSIASISIFSWLNNPNIPLYLVSTLQTLQIHVTI